MIKKYIILRPDGNGGVTCFTNEHGFGICFNDEESAKNHLYELGYTDESYAEEGIVIDTIDVSGVPEFLVQFVYDALINNEPDLSACYYIDDSYRIATTADREGWNCELLCYNTIDNDDVVLENIFVNKHFPQKIPQTITYLHNEYVERMEEDESESEEEEDDEPDCQICGCQTDLYLIKDFNGKGFDARLCGKCLLKEALRKGKILISNAHFKKDGIMLPVFDYLNTILDIEPFGVEKSKYAPWKEYSLSKEECDAWVEKMVETIRSVGLEDGNEGSGYYGLKSFKVDDEKYNLYCEVYKEIEDGDLYFVVYYAIEFDEGDTLWSNWTSSKIVLIDELKEVIFEIASRDYTDTIKQLRKNVKEESNQPKDKESLEEELHKLNAFIDGVECSIDYNDGTVTKETFDKYEKAISRRTEIEALLKN